jgi:hypothetical protein
LLDWKKRGEPLATRRNRNTEPRIEYYLNEVLNFDGATFLLAVKRRA